MFHSRMSIHALVLLFITVAFPGISCFAAGNAPAVASTPEQLQWHDSYKAGYLAAQKANQNLFVFFYDAAKPTKWEEFSQMAQNDSAVRTQLAKFTLAKVSLAEKNEIDDTANRMIQHGAFSELRGSEGLAILDLTHTTAPYYAYVVSVYPFVANPFCVNGTVNKFQLTTMLQLPPGTLTQRSMMFAVRVHEEHPQSANSTCCTILMGEAESHSQYQANITDQGHHNWSSRFHSINAQLSGGLTAQEVVAESWPGENLMQAAKECVYSWRRSPGHWSGVRSPNDRFAYDMKRGRDGIWYATGLFATGR